MLVLLHQLADEYNAMWGLQFAYNDSSLPYGGLFDINGNWQPDHDWHRKGRSQDVRANALDFAIPRGRQDIREWFETRVLQLFGRTPLHEFVDTDREHYHIQMGEDG